MVAGRRVTLANPLGPPIDHVLVAAYTSRFYGPMLEHPSEDVGRAVSERVVQVLEIARNAARGCAPGGRSC